MDQTQVINKSIAAISRRIPYIPELKTYCKTTNSCILMTQLEYRFASMPHGFYKFLSACDHYLYKGNDSWTEELAFSETEVRNAFENIGERYSSAGKVIETFQKGTDPFAGKFYLSFRDVRNNLTFYKRNHKLVNHVVALVIQSVDPIAQQQILDALKELSFLELNNVDAQKLEKLSPGNQVSKSPYIRNQEKTSGDDNKKKLASSLTLDDFREAAIADNLTAKQFAKVQDAVAELSPQYLPGNDSEIFIQAIVFELLDKNSFRKCNQEFSRKLFSVKRQIIKGEWKIPEGFSRKKVSEFTENKCSIQEEINQHKMALNHAERMKSLAEKNNQSEENIMYWQAEGLKSQKWIEKLQLDLTSL